MKIIASKRFVLIIGFSLIASLAGVMATAQVAHSANTQDIDRILVTVNDDVITLSEFQMELDNIVRELRAREAELPRDDILRRQALERMIIERIQIQFAARAGIEVDEELVDRAVGDLARQNNLSVEQLKRVIARDGINFTYFRENLQKQLTIRQLVDREIDNRVTVTDQEIENFLTTEGEAGALDEEYDVSHILVSIPESPSADDVDGAQRRAEEALDQLESGVPFEQIAAEFSDSQDALSGGRLGWKKGGQLPALFVTAIREMQPGEVSELLRSPNGFHILKLNQLRGGAEHMTEQTHLRHILIQPEGLLSEQEAQNRLNQLRDRIQNGEDFAVLAQAHSDDAMTSSNGGDLGWIASGQTAPQ
ncbi:MAG: peptidylprolyl isomerase, partial [Gammaproteobacteria bacterium]|nr:peptidylprolyl isomerase [Gammaproteobacteria bacterium]